jgi:tripartite-type tricarboxylate transporter receptor subunit TctC
MTHAPSRALSRRVFCALSLTAAANPSWAEALRAEPAWPRRPVRLVTRPADGARGDAMARTLAAALGRRWHQPVIVDYRVDGDSAASVETFLAAHDDHVLLLHSTAVWTTFHLAQDHLSFDPVRDLVPLAPVVQDFIAVGVSPHLRVATLAELVDAARRGPGRLSWASSLQASYLAFSAFLKTAGTELTFVPYRNPATLLADLADGKVDLAFLPLPPTMGACSPAGFGCWPSPAPIARRARRTCRRSARPATRRWRSSTATACSALTTCRRRGEPGSPATLPRSCAIPWLSSD